ncbi:TetR/AcrR family transcriptional regulator [Paenibacillus arenilitoris]|uniref:TetR/AcrR family transcriptional regulator n=1 Tax=Paenibacillus arenilitoris TaxID=2772299 RepID=A0A927H4T0_9BACL|nr:TetR/AcrR family transcriptional regulator [Paenibacillus arenilitoris]MBD2868741.1 TetR/AcrR family transcriptional regulator [Paenibacillus arenilitoris]
MAEPGKKTDRRIVRSKSALRQALLELMGRKSFTSISITEIVELANYNRGTFYTHYETKEALLDEILSDLIGDLLRSFRAPYEKTEVFRIDELHARSVMLFDHIYRHASLYKMLFESDVLPSVREKMFVALKKISMDEFEYQDNGIDRELQSAYSINALLGLVFHWIESGFKHSPAYMQEQLVKLVNWRPTTIKTVKKQP